MDQPVLRTIRGLLHRNCTVLIIPLAAINGNDALNEMAAMTS